MHIGFIIADWNSINPANSSTLTIIQECIKRKHTVSIMYTNNLTVRNNIVHGFTETIEEMEKIPENITSFFKKVTFEKKFTALHAFDCLMIRKDPPINPIVFNFLDAIKDEVVIINDVDGIRKANNKLYTIGIYHPFKNNLVIGKGLGKKKIIAEQNAAKEALKNIDS